MTDEREPRSSRDVEPDELEPEAIEPEPLEPVGEGAEEARELPTPEDARATQKSEPAKPTPEVAAQAAAARAGGEELPYIDDPVSRVWVLFLIAVFGAILLYGLLFGRAGMLTPVPTPSPSPSPTVVTPSPSVTPTDPEATPTGSPSVSPSGSPSLTVSPTTSPAPTTPASPSPSPT